MKKRMRKVVMLISVIIIGVCLAVINVVGKGENNKILFLINKVFINLHESEEYREELVSTNYKNYTIVHHKNVEPALNMIYAYLDKIEEKSNEVLGIIPSDKLTIQIDYDKEIFKLRRTLGKSDFNGTGYYNCLNKTMYLSSEDTCIDIIMNIDKSVGGEDGIMYSGVGADFKHTFFHEYTHHLLSCFLRDNNIKEDKIPIWFNEGFSEYLCEAEKYKGQKLTFIPLTTIKTNKQLEEVKNDNKESSVYIEGKYAVNTMINLKGKDSIRNILLKCNENNFEESFEEVMDISLQQFDNILQDKFSELTNIYNEGKDGNLEIAEYIELKLQCLEAYMEQVGYNESACGFLVTAYENDKGFKYTEEFIKECMEKYPEEKLLWRRLGMLYENNDMNDLAEECYLSETSFRK